MNRRLVVLKQMVRNGPSVEETYLNKRVQAINLQAISKEKSTTTVLHPTFRAELTKWLKTTLKTKSTENRLGFEI
ncbi:MAG: hypothetical protein IPP49_12160 [Saprospiraceae bacterium]|nr:hypothetical protein [Saprospiraceae bacterium]